MDHDHVSTGRDPLLRYDYDKEIVSRRLEANTHFVKQLEEEHNLMRKLEETNRRLCALESQVQDEVFIMRRHANAKQNFLYGDFAPALKLEGVWAADLSNLKSELKKLTEERDKIIDSLEKNLKSGSSAESGTSSFSSSSSSYTSWKPSGNSKNKKKWKPEFNTAELETLKWDLAEAKEAELQRIEEEDVLIREHKEWVDREAARDDIDGNSREEVEDKKTEARENTGSSDFERISQGDDVDGGHELWSWKGTRFHFTSSRRQ